MPQAAAAAVASAFAAATGAAAAGTTIATIGAAFKIGIATGLVYAGTYLATTALVSLGLQEISSALTKQPTGNQTTESLGRRLTMARAAAAPRRIVLGSTRVSGILYVVDSTGGTNQYLHCIVLIAGHEVNAINEVYFNSENLNLTADGTDANGETRWVPGSGNKYEGFVRVKKLLGADDQAADADLVAASGNWDNNHRGRGVAYLYVRLEFNQDVFATGLPTISCDIEGAKAYDPRKSAHDPLDRSTWEWTNNSALLQAWYMQLDADRGGLGASGYKRTLIEGTTENGDFENNLTGWTSTTAGSSTVTVDATGGVGSSKAAKLTVDASDNVASVYKANILTVGKKYRLQVYLRGGASDVLDIDQRVVGSTEDTIVDGLVPGTTFKQFNYEFTAFGTDLAFVTGGGAGNANDEIWIDNVVLEELGEIDQAEIVNAANVCDGEERLDAGQTVSSVDTGADTLTVTGHGFSVNDTVSIDSTSSVPAGLSSGTVYFVESVPTVNTLKLKETIDGSAVNITGAGSGTNTLYSAEKKYTCNGTISTSATPAQNLSLFRATNQGWVERIGGAWVIRAGAYQTPTLEFNEDDLRGPIQVNTKISRRDNANAIKGIYAAEENEYQVADFPAYIGFESKSVGSINTSTDVITISSHGWDDLDVVRVEATTMPGGLSEEKWYYLRDTDTNTFSLSETPNGAKVDITSSGTSVTVKKDVYRSEDGGERIFKDLELALTSSPTESQRLAKIELERLRQAVSFSSPCSFKLFQAQVGDTVRWLNTRMGWHETEGTSGTITSVSTGDNEFTDSGHGLSNADPLIINATTTMPGGVTESRLYYVVGATTNTFKISDRVGGDPVDITSAGSGTITWTKQQGKAFEVSRMDLTISSDQGLVVDCDFRETVSTLYDWSNGDATTVDAAPNTNLPDPFTVDAPSSLAVTSGNAGLYTKKDGTIVSRAKLTWTAPSDIFVESGGQQEIQYKRSADSTYLTAAYVDGTATEFFIWDVENDVSYDFRVRAINGLGFKSAFDTVTGHTVLGKDEAPSDISSGTDINGNVYGWEVSWPAVTDADLSFYEIWERMRYEVDENNAADTVEPVSTPHQLQDNEAVLFSNGGGPFSTSQIYWVINRSSTDFQVSETQGGSAVTWGTASSTFRCTRVTEKLVTADSSTDKLTNTGHGFTDNLEIEFLVDGSGSLPGGITAGTNYYVLNADENTFEISTSAGGSKVNITSNGTAGIYAVAKSKLWKTSRENKAARNNLAFDVQYEYFVRAVDTSGNKGKFSTGNFIQFIGTHSPAFPT